MFVFFDGQIGLVLFLSFCLLTLLFTYPRWAKYSLVSLGAIWIVFYLAYISSDYFTGNGIDDAAIYHLWYGLGGAGFMEYLGLIVGVSAALLVLVGILFVAISRPGYFLAESPAIFSSAPLLVLLVSFLFNPGLRDLKDLNLVNISSDTEVSDFHEFYLPPQVSSISKSKKNLVFIYAESLERTYMDENLFPGLLENIRSLEKKATHFTNIKQLRGTGWTIGGITASLCGIPLITPSHVNSMSGLEGFLSGASCFGDLLGQQGYELNFIGGADLRFGGKGKFFETHGFKSVEGREELKGKLSNKGYLSWWGLYDDVVFDMAYERFIALSKSESPFGLFSLTLDTHHPKGHPSKSCKGMKYQDGGNPILNSVKCSDWLISRYINKLAESDYADNTIVVLMSDHLAMRNTAYDALKKGERRDLFLILDLSKPEGNAIDALGSTLDVGSTVLPYLGFKGEIGLGRDLLKSDQEKTKLIHRKIKTWDEDILKFWEFPSIKGNTLIDWTTKTMNLGGKVVNLPALLEVRPNLTTVARFQFHRSTYHKTFADDIKDVREDSYYILLESCENIALIDSSAPSSGFCTLAGSKGVTHSLMVLKEKQTFSARELRQLMGMI